MSHYDVLIIGAGHGGAQAGITLRQNKFAGSVALLGEEHHLPYERPPLSKEYFIGEKSFDLMLIRPASFWSDQSVDLLPGRKVRSVDAAAHEVRLTDDSVIGYGQLIWAAGATPRALQCPGQDARGVHSLRNRGDVDEIFKALPAAQQIVIIGGGYIGLEAAAAMRKLGKAVCVLEAQDRVLARVAAEPLSRFYEHQHRSHGVDVRLGESAELIEVRNGHVAGVRLRSGVTLPADLLLVGIGVVPCIDALQLAGAECGNGVVVDEYCRTTLPDVFAIGDCAWHENPFAHGARIRLESVQNAHDQASVVAKTIVGVAKPYSAIPWFWSNQYDLRLQTIGLSVGYDQHLVRGQPAECRFSVVYLRQGRVIALDCVNTPRDFVQGRALITSGKCVPIAQLADASVELKALVADAPVLSSG